MSYTKIAKPTGTSYTQVNDQGRERYDESSIEYNESTTFYNSINTSQYTNIAKPTGGTTQRLAGMTLGLLIPLTGSQTEITGTDWVKVAKPT